MRAIVSFFALGMLLVCEPGCVSTQRAAQNEAVSVARVMAINSSATLAGRKEREARAMVSSVSASPDVTFVLLFDQDKQLFADYFQPDQADRRNDVIARVKACLPIGADYFIEEPTEVIAISRVEDASKLQGFVTVGVRKK